MRVLIWIANNNARKIQEVYSERLFIKRRAANSIQQRWKKFKKLRASREMTIAQLQRVRKRVAINRIYDMHRTIKVRKVNASTLLMQNVLVHNLAQLKQNVENLDEQVTKIQRFWRCYLTKKYQYGRKLLARKNQKDRLYEQVVGSKYHGLQAVESAHLTSELHFQREHKNLEFYFWKQKVNYAKDLENRGRNIEQRVQQEFIQADWTLNTLTKEWTNVSKNITIKLERQDTQLITTLKEKLVHYYVSNQLPSEEAIHKQLDELAAGKNAMQNLMLREAAWLRQDKLAQIKRQRFLNLELQDDLDSCIDP